MKKKSSKPRIAYHHGNLRDAVMGHAVQILNGAGETIPALRDLAKHAGVTHTALYRHFRSKQDLLACIAERGFEEMKARFDRMTSSADSRDEGVSPLVLLGITYVTYARENPGYYRAMFHPQLGERSLYPSLETRGREVFGYLLEVIGRGMADKVYRKGSIPAAAVAAWSIVHGISTLWLDGQLATPVRQSGESYNDVVKAALETLERGLTRP